MQMRVQMRAQVRQLRLRRLSALPGPTEIYLLSTPVSPHPLLSAVKCLLCVHMVSDSSAGANNALFSGQVDGSGGWDRIRHHFEQAATAETQPGDFPRALAPMVVYSARTHPSPQQAAGAGAEEAAEAPPALLRVASADRALVLPSARSSAVIRAEFVPPSSSGSDAAAGDAARCRDCPSDPCV